VQSSQVWLELEEGVGPAGAACGCVPVLPVSHHRAAGGDLALGMLSRCGLMQVGSPSGSWDASRALGHPGRAPGLEMGRSGHAVGARR